MFCMLVNDDVNLVVEFVITSVSVSMTIRSPQDIYYTSIPSIYVQLGDAVDVLYDSIMFVRMNWYTGDSETTIRDDVMSLSVLYAGCDELCIIRWEPYK